jgi:hypothetical protein
MAVAPIQKLQVRKEPVPSGPLIEAFEREIGRPITHTFRHYLADQPVHCGDILELYREGEWLPGRYEWTGRPDELPTLDFGDETVWLDDDSLVRWAAS